MKRFICFSPKKELFDFQGKSLGMGHDRALYYSARVGRQRIYRSSYPTQADGLTLFSYASDTKAKMACDEINQAFNENFSPLEVDL